MPVRFHFLPEALKEESIGQGRHLPSHLYPLPALRSFIYRLPASSGEFDVTDSNWLDAASATWPECREHPLLGSLPANLSSRKGGEPAVGDLQSAPLLRQHVPRSRRASARRGRHRRHRGQHRIRTCSPAARLRRCRSAPRCAGLRPGRRHRGACRPLPSIRRSDQPRRPGART